MGINFSTCFNQNYIVPGSGERMCQSTGSCCAISKLKQDKAIGDKRKNAEAYAQKTKGCACRQKLIEFAKTFPE